MELHERLASANTGTRTTTVDGAPDPFADLKNRLHLAIIGELGPQLFNLDQRIVRDRVLVDIKERLSHEAGLSRTDRDRLEQEIADDILGYGPLERLLADESVSEVMVNGPFDIWIERDGVLYKSAESFNDES